MEDLSKRRNLWELVVLAFLRERPMHPYEMQRLMQERHKLDLLVLKRGSLYHAIRRLLSEELIESAGVDREGRRPERTTYRITDMGRDELIRWLSQMISTPQPEPSEFMASMSFLVHLSPEDAAARLEERARWLVRQIIELDSALNAAKAHVDRIHLIESEYLQAMRAAELRWVNEAIKELRSGQLAWKLEKFFDDGERRANSKPRTPKQEEQ
jgi:DNA-binding PadR family transcriptional regulator